MKEYIGVLDSGVGGLSVLRELKSLMPNNNFIFFGDTKNMPYGTKTKEELLGFTRNILNFFISKNVKNVVFACNTTSATVYDDIQKEFQGRIKIYPLIQSIAQNAIANLKDNDSIAVFATCATVKSKKYSCEIEKINPKINVFEIDCTGFVEIVENRLYKEQSSIDLIKEKFELLKGKNIKRIILGCTHYPYLVPIFKTILPDVEYFNPAYNLALVVKNDLENKLANQTGDMEFFVSKNPESFKLSAKMFFDIDKEVNLI